MPVKTFALALLSVVVSVLMACWSAGGSELSALDPLDPRVKALTQSQQSPDRRLIEAKALAADFKSKHDFNMAARALAVAGQAAADLVDYTGEEALAAQALGYCRAANNLNCQAVATSNLAVGEINCGHLEAALVHLQQATDLDRRLGDWEGMALDRINVSSVRLELGDHDGALRDLTTLEAVFREAGGWREVLFDLNLADALEDYGKAQPALRAVLRAMAEISRLSGKPITISDDITSITRAESLLGLTLGDTGQFEPALLHHRNALAAATTTLEVFYVRTAYAKTLAQASRFREATEILGPLASLAKKVSPLYTLKYYKIAADVYRHQGSLDEAFSQLTALNSLQSKLYQENMTDDVSASETAIAFSETTERANHLLSKNVSDRLAASQKLLRTERIAAFVIGTLLVAMPSLILFLRFRHRRNAERELALERERIACDIHDTLLQGFVGVSMEIRAAANCASSEAPAVIAARLSSLATQAAVALRAARRAMWQIRVTESGSDDLIGAVSNWLTTVDTMPGVRIVLEATAPLPKLTRPQTAEIAGVIQEAVTNALRHSQPRNIVISLKERGRRVELAIQDDGCGFDIQSRSLVMNGSWGLRGMRERVARAGGIISISSSPNLGTTVFARVPQ